MKLAIIGCGNIAGPYSDDIQKNTKLELAGFYDLDQSRAQTFADKYGGKVYPTLEAALEDSSIDIIVNLTIFNAHYDVVKASLLAGKHVYSEKPLALEAAQAFELVQLAENVGQRLACAPITFLGEAPQTAMQEIRQGKIGPLRLIYAEVNHGRIETWHPNPAPFYAVGPMLDVGVYPLALVTSLLGAAKRLTCFATTLHPKRISKEGVPFVVSSPDFYTVLLEFEGVVMRLTCNFYVPSKSKQGASVEFHGDLGSVRLDSWFMANAKVEYLPFGGENGYEALPLVQEPQSYLDWSRGLQDFSHAILENRVSRVTGAQAAHIVEILEAANTSAKEGRPVELQSTFAPPAPMDWAQ
jgi:predicted dehydrogenase